MKMSQAETVQFAEKISHYNVSVKSWHCLPLMEQWTRTCECAKGRPLEEPAFHLKRGRIINYNIMLQ